MGSIATELAAAVDPVILARQAGVEPDDWQADVLRSPQRRALLNCCRQSGKSSTAAILGTHAALYEPGALACCSSGRVATIAGVVQSKCLDVYRSAGRPVAPEAENRLTLELSNGSPDRLACRAPNGRYADSRRRSSGRRRSESYRRLVCTRRRFRCSPYRAETGCTVARHGGGVDGGATPGTQTRTGNASRSRPTTARASVTRRSKRTGAPWVTSGSGKNFSVNS